MERAGRGGSAREGAEEVSGGGGEEETGGGMEEEGEEGSSSLISWLRRLRWVVKRSIMS